MKYLALFAAAVILLCSCAHGPATVQVPVATPCPVPREVARPHLPIADLRPTDSPDNVVRAYAASVETLMGYARELEMILSGYR